MQRPMADQMNGAFFTETWPTGHTSDREEAEQNDLGDVGVGRRGHHGLRFRRTQTTTG